MSKQEKEATPSERLVDQVEKVKFRNISAAAFRELCLRPVFEQGDDKMDYAFTLDEDLV